MNLKHNKYIIIINLIMKKKEIEETDLIIIKTKNIEKKINIPKEYPWIEKYRPENLDEVLDQSTVINMLNNSIESCNLPHLLFYGPPGTGKTSIILAIAKKMFGPVLYKSRVIELNASDERGIGVVRQKIKLFARSTIQHDTNYPNAPPYKLIILDESDSMTIDAQSATRKIIEDNSAVTRFCFICNYIGKISEPIKSRCAIFKFSPISNDCALIRLKEIMKKENMEIKDEELNTIVNIANGDMRKCIMILQNVKYYLEYFAGKNNVEKNILEIAGYQANYIYNNIFEYCFKEDIYEIVKLAKRLHENGYPIDNILKELCKIIVFTDKIKDKKKATILINFSSIQKRLNDGSDEYIGLLHLLLEIHKNR